MRKSNITASFDADLKTVWGIVTNNENYAWRSDLLKIEVSDHANSFTEYTKNGFSTNFVITVKEDYKRYEFDMSNQNMVGHWTGIFSKIENGGTLIDFTEEIHIKNPMMEVLSYLFMNLKKMQETYVKDLKKQIATVGCEDSRSYR